MSRLAGLVVLVSLMLLVRLVLGDHASLPGVRSSMSFGFLLLAAYLSGDLLARWRLPRITGYILAGVAFGPQLSGLVGADTVSELNRRDELTLIFVTHNLLLASRLATHVALFHDGHVRTGRAETLLQHDVLEPAFGISVNVATAREAL